MNLFKQSDHKYMIYSTDKSVNHTSAQLRALLETTRVIPRQSGFWKLQLPADL